MIPLCNFIGHGDVKGYLIPEVREMYASDIFAQHNVYPTMNVVMIYAVIAMCLEFKAEQFSDKEIIDFVKRAFKKRKQFFEVLQKIINILPNSYQIAKMCKIFCMMDEYAYANLPKHVKFVRHSDLANGECCHDEVVRK